MTDATCTQPRLSPRVLIDELPAGYALHPRQRCSALPLIRLAAAFELAASLYSAEVCVAPPPPHTPFQHTSAATDSPSTLRRLLS